MKKLYVVFVSAMVAVLLCSTFTLFATADTDVEWTSSNYSLSQTESGIEASGSGEFGNKCSTTSKIDLDGCVLTLALEFDYNEYSFDWVGVVFAPSEAPYLMSGGAVTLLLRPRGAELVFTIINSNFTELASATVPFENGGTWAVSTELSKTSIAFTVNGTKVSTDNTSLNYAILSRGVYCSVCVNAGSSAPFKLAIENTNVRIHDASQDKIVYGATISIKDENIAYLVSDNTKISGEESGQKGNKGCNSSMNASCFALGAMLILAAFVLPNKKLRGNK